MCGIVGYIGCEQAAPLLLDGLRRLEYRGYDSSGIATLDNVICCAKAEGRLSNLKTDTLKGNAGIGHTRWATHGEPNQKNAHPHLSANGKFAIVHNGIIENHTVLRNFLCEKGFIFKSDTDSEIIAHLLQYYYCGNTLEALKKTTEALIGSYAIGAIHEGENAIFAAKKDSPLVIGLSQNGNYISSDMPALLNRTRDFYILDQNEYAVIKDKVEIFNKSEAVKKQAYRAVWNKEEGDKGHYPHFMLKEIFEQPEALKKTFDMQSTNPLVFLDGVSTIHLIGCGSAYHAALSGKYIIESTTKVKVIADIASEFRYRRPILHPDDLVIAISQSGETADTIGGLKISNCKTACIVNVPESTLSHLATPMYTAAGPEVAVATTKGYTTQLMNLYLIAAALSDKTKPTLLSELKNLPGLTEQVLSVSPQIKELSKLIAPHDYAFFIGRGADYAAAKEAALKLKEISYIHADCYPAGELKHGTISLIQRGSPVIAIATDKKLVSKTSSNVREVKTRGAFVIGISPFDLDCDHLIKIPKTSFVSPLLASVACQLLAYFTACERGCDIDKPRNLAKSVTVE